MNLLEFQRDAVDSVIGFYDEIINATISSGKRIKSSKILDKASLAWILSGNSSLKQYCPITTMAGESVPNVALCIPTGGGKTIVGLTTAIEILSNYSDGKPNFIVWMVPSEAIYSQVINDFSRGGSYYKYVQNKYSRSIGIKKISDTWVDQDLEPSSTTILVISFQSIIRKNSSKSLQVYRNADKVSSISLFMGSDSDPSLYGLMKKVRPIFVIDESHRYYTEIGRDFFKQDLIASLIIELSATHKQYSPSDYPNIVFSANGKTLIDEQLIKKPIVYHSFPAAPLADLLKSVIEHQAKIELLASRSLSRITPKVLISSEYTGAGQAGQEYSAQNIRSLLIKFGIFSDCIAIKSSEIDEINGRNLDDASEKIRFIITKRALMEGWDCKSIYTIMLVNKIGADVTNFQLIGRGLRQPNRTYSKHSELNELHLFTNSISHDVAVKKLTSFLSDSGLSDSSSELVVSADNRILHNFTLISDFQIDLVDTLPAFFLSKKYISMLYFSHKSLDFTSFIVKDNEIPEAEEFIQKIDLSRQQSFGLRQGRLSTRSKNSSHRFRIDYANLLHEFLFIEISLVVPIASIVHKIISSQLMAIADHKLAYLSRTHLLLSLKNRISQGLDVFLDQYFEKNILPSLTLSSTKISDIFGSHLSLYAMPDLALDRPFSNCLYGNLPKALLNADELAFARDIDRLPNIKWMRNIPISGIGFPYARGNFYPDFILIKNSSEAKSEVLFVETKGIHLLDNIDSKSKGESCKRLSTRFFPIINLFFGDFESALTAARTFAK